MAAEEPEAAAAATPSSNTDPPGALAIRALDEMPLPVLRFTPDGSLLGANRAASTRWHRADAWWAGRHLRDLGWPADDELRWHDAIGRASQGPELVVLEQREVHDGATRTLRVELRAVPDPGGRSDQVLAVCRDITDDLVLARQAAEDRRLAEDLGQVVDLVAVLDDRFRFLYVNEVAVALSGRPADDWLGRTLVDLGADRTATTRFTTALAEAFGTGEPQVVQLHLPFSGVDLEARITPRRNEGGSVDRAVVIARDITERLRAADALDAERRRLSATIDSLFDPLVQLVPERDADGQIIDFTYTGVNDAACAFHHAAREDMIGRHLSADFPEAFRDAVMAGYQELVATGDRLAIDDLEIPPGSVGEGRRIDLRAVWVGDALVVTWRDVTERRTVDERFRILAENASDVVIMGPGDTDATSWISPSVTRVLGWQPEDWLGHSPIEFIHPDDLERLMKDLAADRCLGQQVDEYRVRRPDGTYSWVSVASSTVDDADGEVVLRLAVLRDISEAVADRQRLADSEERYRLLVETTSDVVYQTDAHGIIEWVSPSAVDVLGWDPDDLVGTSAFDLLPAEDRIRVDEQHHHQPTGHPRRSGQTDEVRFRQADGRLRWMAVRARPVLDDHGTPLGAVIGLRDCHEEVLIRRAVRTQEAGHVALATTDDEHELLSMLCQAAVDRGGYEFAWYGRRVDDEEHDVQPVASGGDHRRYLERVHIRWDDGPLGQGPGGQSIRSGRTVVFDDLGPDTSFGPWSEAASDEGFRSTVCLPVVVNDVVDGALMVYASEPDAFDERAVALLEDLATLLGYGIRRIRDRVALEAALHERALLTTAIDQAGEAVVVTDPDATIVYANPAAGRSSGYSVDELVGSNPRVLQSGRHDPAFYDAMWTELTNGRTWNGILVNRRKDGALYEEEATITPVHDASGALTAYVGVKHDLTRERSLEAEVDRAQQDRAAVAELLRSIAPSGTLGETIDDFCAAVRRLPFIDSAVVLLLTGDEAVLVTGDEDRDIGRVPVPAIADFLDRTAEGPWWIDLTRPGEGFEHPMLARIRADGFHATAYAPIRKDGRVLAVLAVGSRDEDFASWMPDRLATIEELASFAGTLFGADVEQQGASDAARDRIQRVLDDAAFHPVFQPVVTADTHEVVGYEALTRFDDGTRPDLFFAEAHAVGLGIDAEVACATAALAAAAALPDDRWVSINLSPAAVLSGALAAPLHASARRIIVEITEHEPIESYPDLRASIDDCGGCEISVDDAGAGYASLRHILELQPDVVKLDIALVRDIDGDPARQALAAGLCHFAEQTGTTLIAEGVETDAEAAVLAGLGVDLMQGYRFGRPEPLP